MVETAHADPLVGSMLGKNYRVLELIGVGGMAVVYLVEHQTLLKRFAAKVLRSEHASSVEARARFTQEAHAASQLDHENIVGISDFGVTTDHRPFFVMEFLRGQTLADRLDEGPMSLEEVVAVCVPAARALAHAHAEGIVHRDVKPENIMLVQRSQGRWGVKVLDFGIAKVEENDRMTKTGQAIGSPMYMSPEACRGDDVDMRADVYSFGIVLYLMFAGRVPFSDENILKILQMQVSSPVPPPTTFAPNLSPEIEAVIMKAVAKDIDERYSNMEELLVALEDALPEGSDVLLLQAQHGAAATPFPGSLERVRAANASGNFRVHTTGQHNVQVTGQHTPQPSHPPAPTRRRGRALMFALGAVLVLGGAGGGYVYWDGLQDSDASSSAPIATTVTPTTATVPTTTSMTPPTTSVTPPVENVAAANPTPEPTVVPTTVEPTEVVDEAEPEAAVPEKETTIKDRKRKPQRNVRTAAAPVVKKETRPVPKATTTTAPTTTAPATTAPATTVAMTTTTAPASSLEATPTTKTEMPAPPTPPTTATKDIPTEVTPKQPSVPDPTPKVAPKVEVGSLDATPTIGTLGVEGSLPSSVVRHSVERVLPSLQACYRTAAKAKNSTPLVSVKVRFVIDESGSARRVSASGSFGSLADCVRESMSRVRSPNAPDVGTVSVTVGIKFTPT